MSRYTNHPHTEQPDWAPPIGVLCGSCGSSSNFCRVSAAVNDQKCCSGCSHSTVLAMPSVWDGDNA